MEVEHHKDRLAVPQTEAAQKINIQIHKGNAIIQQVMSHGTPTERAKTEGAKWSDYNRQLLKKLFVDDAIAQGYNQIDIITTVSQSSDPCAKLRKLINYLDSVLGQLELMEEPATERWFQNRTIQAALISASVLVLVSVTGWFLNSRSPKKGAFLQKNVSTSPDVQTRGNLSPAVVASGPNSQVNIYLTPGQSEKRPELGEPDVNQPEQSPVKDIQKLQVEPGEEVGAVDRPQSGPLIKKREPSIQPAETEGEVNEPEKGELKKRESAIAPDETDGEVRKTK